MSRNQSPSNRVLIGSVIAGVLVLGLAASIFAQQDRTPLKLTAFAVNLNAERPAAQANIVEIRIDRWSADQERTVLLDRLRTGGETAALAALQKTPRVGYLRTPDHVGWDLHYAHEIPSDDGGRRIFIATDRPIAFWESANLTRSFHYPFTLIEIHLGPDGKGEGRMTVATKATLGPDGKHLELESYSSQPVMLEQVHVEK